MTVEEFDNYLFAKGDSVRYCGHIYPITGINFVEKLFEIRTDYVDKVAFYSHVRCENVEFIPLTELNQKP